MKGSDYVKYRKLTRNGSSSYLTIPTKWLRWLNVKKGDDLMMFYHPFNHEIIIKPIQSIKLEPFKIKELNFTYMPPGLPGFDESKHQSVQNQSKEVVI